MQKIIIREVKPEDADAVAILSGELGYPLAAETARERIRTFLSMPNRTVFVACAEDQQVVGWIDVALTQHLQADLTGEIGGLVVKSDYRNFRIGQRLVKCAEKWVCQQGVFEMVVRSRATREDAHRFYRREGYEVIKTSTVFGKTLSSERAAITEDRE